MTNKFMEKKRIAIVDDVILIDFLITVGSDEWFDWLSKNKSFRYEPKQYGRTLRAEITIRNRNGNYWYGYRKVNNKLRQFYLGKTDSLDYERLNIAVDELSLDNVSYWRNYFARKAA